MKPSPQTRCSKNGGRFILSSFLFILFLCILASVNEIRLGTLSYISKCINVEGSVAGEVAGEDELRILIGILTLPGSFHRRDFLRQVYGIQQPVAGAQIDVKFVFCNITDDDQAFLVSLEILRHNDIIILNCTENMNRGKSFTYFSSLPAILDGAGDPPYNYVMKADDDTYVRFGNLAKSLTSLPRHDLYYGYVIPCESMDPFHFYMSGMGYLISWDIVEWLGAQSKIIPTSRVIGPEDKVFGDLLKSGNRGKNRFNEKPGMYNYPDPPNKCSHELWPGTVAVHLLKTPEKWIKTLRYFNVTQNLKPSSFYPIDQFY
ncbi:hypothetical protein V2J09_010253 [Rumex salicifolius]